MRQGKFFFSMLICFVLAVVIIANSQTTGKKKIVQVSGRVVDAKTGAPLPYANIFLANTTRGAASDVNGNYLIERVEPGNYEIVVSVIGYELETRPITITEQKKQVFNFRLNPKPIEAPKLEVEAEVPEEWRNRYKAFRRIFLGTSRFSRECEILNPEYLEFQFDENTFTLHASASRPLEILNRALGYKILFTLTDYTSKTYSDVRYFGYSQFTPLQPKDEKEARKWQKNREEVFRGSLRHFLISLVQNRVREEGFDIFLVPDLRKDLNEIQTNRVKATDICRPGQYPGEWVLSFDSFLKVVYTGEGEAKEFVDYARDNFTALLSRNRLTTKINRSNHQVSGLKLNYGSVIVSASGQLRNPYGITTYGYWGWEERFSTQLPTDYFPEKEEE